MGPMRTISSMALDLLLHWGTLGRDVGLTGHCITLAFGSVCFGLRDFPFGFSNTPFSCLSCCLFPNCFVVIMPSFVPASTAAALERLSTPAPAFVPAPSRPGADGVGSAPVTPMRGHFGEEVVTGREDESASGKTSLVLVEDVVSTCGGTIMRSQGLRFCCKKAGPSCTVPSSALFESRTAFLGIISKKAPAPRDSLSGRVAVRSTLDKVTYLSGTRKTADYI